MVTEARGGSASIAQSDYWWYRIRSVLLRTVFHRYIEDGRDVLDVGSADGPSVDWLRGSRLHVTLDLDPRGLQAGSGVCGSALELPFGDESFDVVGAFDVLEHCDPEATVVAEWARVLKPGGRLLISVPAYQWAWSDFDEHNGHWRRYTRERAVAAIEAGGFEVVRSTYAFASTFPFFVAERLWRRLRQTLSRATSSAADIVPLPSTAPWIDRMLLGLGKMDDRMLGKRDLPFGSSVLVAARKPRSAA